MYSVEVKSRFALESKEEVTRSEAIGLGLGIKKWNNKAV